mmetsp:Transcript_31873/g.91474  ORF Transcript_31873/g.91474 Transcript_31873/m.91474 type:complete len:278 (+) Transcript_31873:645-1478(+)
MECLRQRVGCRAACGRDDGGDPERREPGLRRGLGNEERGLRAVAQDPEDPEAPAHGPSAAVLQRAAGRHPSPHLFSEVACGDIPPDHADDLHSWHPLHADRDAAQGHPHGRGPGAGPADRALVGEPTEDDAVPLRVHPRRLRLGRGRDAALRHLDPSGGCLLHLHCIRPPRHDECHHRHLRAARPAQRRAREGQGGVRPRQGPLQHVRPAPQRHGPQSRIRGLDAGLGAPGLPAGDGRRLQGGQPPLRDAGPGLHGRHRGRGPAGRLPASARRCQVP